MLQDSESDWSFQQLTVKPDKKDNIMALAERLDEQVMNLIRNYLNVEEHKRAFQKVKTTNNSKMPFLLYQDLYILKTLKQCYKSKNCSQIYSQLNKLFNKKRSDVTIKERLSRKLVKIPTDEIKEHIMLDQPIKFDHKRQYIALKLRQDQKNKSKMQDFEDNNEKNNDWKSKDKEQKNPIPLNKQKQDVVKRQFGISRQFKNQRRDIAKKQLSIDNRSIKKQPHLEISRLCEISLGFKKTTQQKERQYLRAKFLTIDLQDIVFCKTSDNNFTCVNKKTVKTIHQSQKKKKIMLEQEKQKELNNRIVSSEYIVHMMSLTGQQQFLNSISMEDKNQQPTYCKSQQQMCNRQINSIENTDNSIKNIKEIHSKNKKERTSKKYNEENLSQHQFSKQEDEWLQEIARGDNPLRDIDLILKYRPLQVVIQRINFLRLPINVVELQKKRKLYK